LSVKVRVNKNAAKYMIDSKKGLLTETNGLNVKKKPELKYKFA
jgi:hypothetical protein